MVVALIAAASGYLAAKMRKYKAKAEGDGIYAGIAERAWKELDHAHARIDALEREIQLQVKRWVLAVPLLEEYASGNAVREAQVAEIRLLNGLHKIDKGGER